MTDYTPFGMMQVGRSWNAGGGYRYGFNGKENDNEAKGEGNQQDYGMRIYDPRLGRFLSVDPLTQSYPWYTPYQFAGNKPIRYIDLDGAEEWDIVKNWINNSVDMAYVPKSYTVGKKTVVTSYTLHGWGRNYLYFWDKVIKNDPDFLDPLNKELFYKNGRAPRFSEELKAHWEAQGRPTDGLVVGEILEHHHVNQGRTAVPLTKGEHAKIPRQTSKSIRAAKLGGLASFLGIVADFAALQTGNPDAWINQFGSQNEIGVVYKNVNSKTGLYYTLTTITGNEYEKTATFDIYNSVRYDDKLKKYVGDHKVGSGYSYQQSSGYSETVSYDNDGKVESVETKGVKSPGVL
jgi:RHS repeat-associated protein